FRSRPQAGPLDFAPTPAPSAVCGSSVASRLLQERGVAERQADAAREHLAAAGLTADIDVHYRDSASPGSSLTLWTDETVRRGADALGRKGLAAEEVGRQTARLLVERARHPAPVEEHLADNLIPLLGMLGGTLHCQVVSPHTRANVYVVERFAGQPFEVEGERISFQPRSRWWR
ncbi:MAG: hypothetical protein AB1758_28100, partial [Candidatus Eremiobacterota bacterium]